MVFVLETGHRVVRLLLKACRLDPPGLQGFKQRQPPAAASAEPAAEDAGGLSAAEAEELAAFERVAESAGALAEEAASAAAPLAPAGPSTPAGPSAPARGGHDDPLRMGTTAPPAPKGPRPERARPRGVGRVLAVASGKGGVGKSTVAARIALALRADGQRAGLLDLDVYGPSVPLLFGADEKPEVRGGVLRPVVRDGLPLLSIGLLVDDAQALAWRGPMVMGAVRQLTAEADWTGSDGQDGPLDWLVIDTPPGTGDAHLSLVQRVVVDAAVLVTTPSPLALADLARGRQLFSRTKVPVLGIVENMAEPGGPFGEGLTGKQLADLGLPSLLRLPLSADLAALPASGAPLGLERFAPVLDALASLDSPRQDG